VLFADPFAIPEASVLAYGKYAPRDSPPASLGLDENHPTSSPRWRWLGLDENHPTSSPR
jgi:hypothetical protein